MKRLIPLFFLLLLLTGCSWGTDYLSVEPHVEEYPYVTSPTETEPVSVVSNRTELRGAILSLIDNWKEQDTILIRDYEGDVAQNLSEVMDYATRQHPTGAYAVDYSDWEILEENGQQMIRVSFVFRRSISEISAIVLVDNSDDAYGKITEALDNYSTSLTLRIRRYSDRDFATEIEDYCMENPRTIPCIPDFSLKLYPEEGEHRILELHLTYPASKDVMREKLLELETTFESAITYGKTGKTPLEKAQRLCQYLIRRRSQTLADRIPELPVYSLLSESVGHDLSYAMCFHDLCSSLGLSSYIVKGSRNAEPYYWNLLVFDDQVFHVDLRRYVEQGARTMEPLYDETLLAEGYEWDRPLYPAAPDPEREGENATEATSSPEGDPAPTPPPTEPVPTETEVSSPTEPTVSPTESTSAPDSSDPAESVPPTVPSEEGTLSP